MKRRQALAGMVALAGATGVSVLTPGAAARPIGAIEATVLPARAHAVLAWGPGGCWLEHDDASLRLLEGSVDPGAPPVPTAHGIWGVTNDGGLRCWRADTRHAWTASIRKRFDAPVHALAASDDGLWILIAQGQGLSLLDASGRPVKTFEGTDLARRRRGSAQALFHLPQRRSFLAAWPELGELWEMSLDPGAPPVFDGLVHDYRMAEAIATPGYLGARRAPLGVTIPALAFADRRVPWVAGVLQDAVAVVHLDVRRQIALLPVPGALPQTALLQTHRNMLRWWLPAGSAVHVFDVERWTSVEHHALPGPVSAMQALDDAVWVVAGNPGSERLLVWRGSDWQRAGKPAGRLRAVRADPQGQAMLVATSDPAGLHLLDAEGHTLKSWELPVGTRLQGVDWVPRMG